MGKRNEGDFPWCASHTMDTTPLLSLHRILEKKKRKKEKEMNKKKKINQIKSLE